MNTFSNTEDKVDERGFINKDRILKYVSEEDIFELVFGYKPVEFEYVTSPFRDDKTPGCWFERDISTSKLRFIDFANNEIVGGIKMKNMDCFNAIQVYFKLKNFYRTLEFIKTKLIDGKDIKHDIIHIKPSTKQKRIVKKEVKIYISTRDFNSRDKNFWSRYGISKQNLIDDKVFPVKKFKLLNTKKGDFVSTIYDICYAYTEFDSERKKLYRPFKKGKGRFITNCKANDIGGLKSLVPFGRQLIISKSYKDFRVLKNQGLNVVWFQNEGMFPSSEELTSLIERFNKVVIFFDNDEPGIIAANKLRDIVNSNFPKKARSICLPIVLLQEDIKDPSDLYKNKGEKMLHQFLKDKKLIL